MLVAEYRYTSQLALNANVKETYGRRTAVDGKT